MAQESGRNTRRRGRAPLDDMAIWNMVQDLDKDLYQWVRDYALPGEIPAPNKKKEKE